MIEIQGKRNSAIVYADKIDKETKTQITSLLREEAYSDSEIRIMPDTHSSKGTVVGNTMTLTGRVTPSLLGVDIGCGMETVFLEESEIDLALLDRVIHERVPCGADVHTKALTDSVLSELSKLHCFSAVDIKRALCSVGTLGSGNHFIELDRDRQGRLILVIHSGSRKLGSDVAAFYKDQAYRYQCRKARKILRRSEYDRRGENEFSFKSSRREERAHLKVNYESALLEGALFENYLNDVEIVCSFAKLNRQMIASIICDAMGLHIADSFTCVHNYIDTKHMILRKGAISARLNERVIIPLNMRDGAILGRGLGCPEWNFSAPHGAGRACSRTDARYAFSVEDFQAQMKGIYTTTANEGSLDECPMAYKAPERILNLIGDTVEVEQVICPVYNFKAC